MDENLCEFFYQVMKKLLVNFTNENGLKLLKRTLPEIRKRYKGNHKLTTTAAHSLPRAKCHSPLHKFAYLYECSTYISSSVYKHFQQILKKNDMGKLLVRKSLNICCLIGGTASEAVAIIKLLTGHCDRMWDASTAHMKFHVTFVDVDDGWKNMAEVVLKTLEEDQNGLHVAKITYSFIAADTSQPLQSDVIEVFQSSDIISLMKFFFEISDMKSKGLSQLLKTAFRNMKSESLFFFMDSPTGEYIERLNVHLPKYGCFQNIYKEMYECHTLSLQSLQEHLRLYSDHFSMDLGCSYSLMSVAAWLKTKDSRRGSHTEEESFLAGRHPSRPVALDKRKFARRNMLSFRKSVGDLFALGD